MIEGVDINWDTIPVSSPVIKLVHVANFNELNAVNVVGKLMCCIVFACYVGFGQHKLMRVHKKAVGFGLHHPPAFGTTKTPKG